jgi:hypothetical protein
MLREPRSRSARYLEQAERLQLLATMETQPRARARLSELADEYQQLAHRKPRKQGDSSASARRRNEPASGGFAPV